MIFKFLYHFTPQKKTWLLPVSHAPRGGETQASTEEHQNLRCRGKPTKASKEQHGGFLKWGYP